MCSMIAMMDCYMLNDSDDESLYPLSTTDKQMHEKVCDIVVLPLDLLIRVLWFSSGYNIFSCYL